MSGGAKREYLEAIRSRYIAADRAEKSRLLKRGIATTCLGSSLKHQVAIRTNQWDETRPGYFEADSIAHCGTSMAGMFVYTINLVAKVRIGSKIVKHHGFPMTRYQRVLAFPHLKPAVKRALTKQFQTLDPFQLHRAMVKKINAILALATYP